VISSNPAEAASLLRSWKVRNEKGEEVVALFYILALWVGHHEDFHGSLNIKVRLEIYLFRSGSKSYFLTTSITTLCRLFELNDNELMNLPVPGDIIEQPKSGISTRSKTRQSGQSGGKLIHASLLVDRLCIIILCRTTGCGPTWPTYIQSCSEGTAGNKGTRANESRESGTYGAPELSSY